MGKPAMMLTLNHLCSNLQETVVPVTADKQDEACVDSHAR